jgi:hypothetical protein
VVNALRANDQVHRAAANDYPFPIRVVPPLRWNILFGQITAPRVKKFATSNRTHGIRFKKSEKCLARILLEALSSQRGAAAR